MTLDESKRLFEYTVWANAATFDAAAALPPDQLRAAVASSFPSLLGTLAHIAGGEWVWLERWLGRAPAGMPEWVAAPDLARVRERLRAVEADRAGFLRGLAEGDLGRIVAYRLFNGKESASPLDELMRHVANHSTYHRGQAATQMRQLGATPPSTDYVRYLREAAAPAPVPPAPAISPAGAANPR